MKRDPMESPKEQPPSESTPDPKGVEFVRGEDLDEWENMLISAVKRAIARKRSTGSLPEQQKPEK